MMESERWYKHALVLPGDGGKKPGGELWKFLEVATSELHFNDWVGVQSRLEVENGKEKKTE